MKTKRVFALLVVCCLAADASSTAATGIFPNVPAPLPQSAAHFANQALAEYLISDRAPFHATRARVMQWGGALLRRAKYAMGLVSIFPLFAHKLDIVYDQATHASHLSFIAQSWQAAVKSVPVETPPPGFHDPMLFVPGPHNDLTHLAKELLGVDNPSQAVLNGWISQVVKATNDAVGKYANVRHITANQIYDGKRIVIPDALRPSRFIHRGNEMINPFTGEKLTISTPDFNIFKFHSKTEIIHRMNHGMSWLDWGMLHPWIMAGVVVLVFMALAAVVYVVRRYFRRRTQERSAKFDAVQKDHASQTLDPLRYIESLGEHASLPVFIGKKSQLEKHPVTGTPLPLVIDVFEDFTMAELKILATKGELIVIPRKVNEGTLIYYELHLRPPVAAWYLARHHEGERNQLPIVNPTPSSKINDEKPLPMPGNRHAPLLVIENEQRQAVARATLDTFGRFNERLEATLKKVLQAKRSGEKILVSWQIFNSLQEEFDAFDPSISESAAGKLHLLFQHMPKSNGPTEPEESTTAPSNPSGLSADKLEISEALQEIPKLLDSATSSRAEIEKLLGDVRAGLERQTHNGTTSRAMELKRRHFNELLLKAVARGIHAQPLDTINGVAHNNALDRAA